MSQDERMRMVENAIIMHVETIKNDFKQLHDRQQSMINTLENDFIQNMPDQIKNLSVADFLIKFDGDLIKAFDQLFINDKKDGISNHLNNDIGLLPQSNNQYDSKETQHNHNQNNNNNNNQVGNNKMNNNQSKSILKNSKRKRHEYEQSQKQFQNNMMSYTDHQYQYNKENYPSQLISSNNSSNTSSTHSHKNTAKKNNNINNNLINPSASKSKQIWKF